MHLFRVVHNRSHSSGNSQGALYVILIWFFLFVIEATAPANQGSPCMSASGTIFATSYSRKRNQKTHCRSVSRTESQIYMRVCVSEKIGKRFSGTFCLYLYASLPPETSTVGVHAYAIDREDMATKLSDSEQKPSSVVSRTRSFFEWSFITFHIA